MFDKLLGNVRDGGHIRLGSLVLGHLSWVTRLAQLVLDHLSCVTCPGSLALGYLSRLTCPRSLVLGCLSWWFTCHKPPFLGHRSCINRHGYLSWATCAGSEHDKWQHFGREETPYLGRGGIGQEGGNRIQSDTLINSDTIW